MVMKPLRFSSVAARRSSSRGFTIVEVVIAVMILAVMATGIIASLTYASRVTRLNTNAVAAKNIAQSYLERMAIDKFENVGPAHYPNIDYNSDPPVYLDRALNIRCRIQFQFSGFGTITDASKSQLTDSNVGWDNNQWNGDTVFIVSGPGAGQFGTINFNTVNTLHLTAPLAVAPLKGAKYLINNGKTVKITTTWKYLGREYSSSIESLIINQHDSPDLGF